MRFGGLRVRFVRSIDWSSGSSGVSRFRFVTKRAKLIESTFDVIPQLSLLFASPAVRALMVDGSGELCLTGYGSIPPPTIIITSFLKAGWEPGPRRPPRWLTLALTEAGLVERQAVEGGGAEKFLYLVTERGRGLINRFFSASTWFFDLEAAGGEAELLGVGMHDLRRLVGEGWRWNEWRFLRGFVVEMLLGALWEALHHATAVGGLRQLVVEPLCFGELCDEGCALA